MFCCQKSITGGPGNNGEKYSVIKRRVDTEESREALSGELQDYDWSPVLALNDAEVSYDEFSNTLVSLYDKHCPIKEITYLWIVFEIEGDLKLNIACHANDLYLKSFLV